MSRTVLIGVVSLALAFPIFSSGRPAAGVGAGARMQFRIRTILTSAGESRVASDATVVGPAGTDLSVDASAGPFSMAARLKTDALPSGRVRIKADVATRRGAGVSERGLARYEEDIQTRVVELAADGAESLVVMPFGRHPGGEELAVEVTPTAIFESPSGAESGPVIRIEDPGPESWIRVGATVRPHVYRVDAELADGERVVASGSAPCAIEEPGPVQLLGPAGETVATLLMSVDRFTKDCPGGEIAFSFDLSAPGVEVVRGWAGVVRTGSSAEYELRRAGEAISGGPTTLRLRITPADPR